MNVTNILRVADAIENAELAKKGLLGFNMQCTIAPRSGTFDRDHTPYQCDSVGCIAGWTVMLLAPDKAYCPCTDAAQDLLGLTSSEAWDLFFPTTQMPYRNIKPHHAVQVLRNLAQTGAVDWTGVLGD